MSPMKASIKPSRLLWCAALLLWLLFVSAVSSSYLVEGARNWLGLQFPSKDWYVFTVRAVDVIYIAISLALVYACARPAQADGTSSATPPDAEENQDSP